MRNGFNQNAYRENETKAANQDKSFSDITVTTVLNDLKTSLAKQATPDIAGTSRNIHQAEPKQEKGLFDDVVPAAPKADRGIAFHEKPHLAAKAIHARTDEGSGETVVNVLAGTAKQSETDEKSAGSPLSIEPAKTETNPGKRIYRHETVTAAVPANRAKNRYSGQAHKIDEEDSKNTNEYSEKTDRADESIEQMQKTPEPVTNTAQAVHIVPHMQRFTENSVKQDLAAIEPPVAYMTPPIPMQQQAVLTLPVSKVQPEKVRQQSAADGAHAAKHIFHAEPIRPAHKETAVMPPDSGANDAVFYAPQLRGNNAYVQDTQVAIQNFHVDEPQDKKTKRFVKKIQAQHSRRDEKSVAYSIFVVCIVVMLLLTGYTTLYHNRLTGDTMGAVNSGQDVAVPRPEEQTEPGVPPVSMHEKDGVTYLKIEGHEMILVNKEYALPESYDKGVDPKAQAAFEEMALAAQKDGFTIYVVSGFRSYETQYYIYNRNVSYYGEEETNTFSAKPGHSEHQTGLAFDLAGTTDSNAILTGSFKDTPEYAWLTQHAAEYGFILRYPEGKMNVTGYIFEPWHYRYVGPELAQILTDSGLTVEEYAGLA